MLSNGIELLLAARQNLELFSFSASGIQTIEAEIERVRPDVVIINEEPESIAVQQIFSLLKAYPSIRIITLSLEDNLINIYDNRKIAVTGVGDLVAAITGSLPFAGSNSNNPSNVGEDLP